MKLKSSFHLIMGLAIVLSLLPALAVAAPAQPASKIDAQLLDLFAVKGSADFVVEFNRQADLSEAYSMGWAERGEFVYDTLQAFAAQTQARAKSVVDGLGLRSQTFFTGNKLYVFAGSQVAAEALAGLSEVAVIRAPHVAYIDPVITSETAVPQSPDATAWGITYTKADQFWTAFGVQGDGMVVANIDTGVQWNHPALDQAFKCATPTDPVCWSDPENTCGAGGACDNNGHGTHTMGTMVADDDLSLTWQAGMAPNAQWIACKGCATNSCSEFALLACGDWIEAPNGNSANRPNVVNNSWGGAPDGDDWYLDTVNAWRAAGIFPAFSAGNSGPTCGSMGDPGSYVETFASGMINSSGVIDSGSSRGPSAFGTFTKPNIAAPGVSVCSTVPTNSWSCGYTGTSMASPHSAGAVALLWSCNPALVGQIDATVQYLQSTAAAAPAGSCGTSPDGGDYVYGYGYLDVLAAGGVACGDIDTGHINGYVYEADGTTPISGATVSAAPGLNSGGQIDATTDPTGYYSMTLPVGTYNVTASKVAYASETVTGVVVQLDQTTQVDFTLDYLGSWTAGPTMCFDLTRIDAEFFPATGKVYILGGRGGADGGTTYGNIYEFDPATGTCTDTGDTMPVPISNYSIILLNNGAADRLCTFGGRNSAGTMVQDVQCYDPVAGTASVVTQLPAAFNTFLPGGLAVVDNKAYVFGGFRSTASPYHTNVTYRYDPVANSFAQIGNLSLGRGYINMAVVDGKIYGFGGDTYDGANLVAQTKAEVMADPGGAGTWDDAAVADLTTASGEGRAFGFDSSSTYGLANQIVIAGGGQWPDNTLEALKYDIASDTYDYNFADLITSRRNHAGVFVPLCSEDPADGLPGMWVIGGRSGSDTPPYAPAEYYPLPCATEPDASFTAEPAEGCAPLEVQFTDTSTGIPTEWAWDFGDGGASAEQDPLYTYVTPGTFEVTLTVTNTMGSDTVTGTVTVYESPVADFDWPTPVVVGEAVQFTDTSSGSPVSWLWQTSDGYTYNIQNPQHTFYTAGDFLVTLTVTNSMGCADTFEQTVTVIELYKLYLPIVVKN